VLDDFVSHTGLMRLLRPASRYPSPKLRAFVDFIPKHLFAIPPGRCRDCGATCAIRTAHMPRFKPCIRHQLSVSRHLSER
jgi:hypothetical protein